MEKPSKTKPDPITVANVPLNSRANAIIDKLRDDTGIPKVEAIARIVEWFAQQDRKFRLAILTRDLETQRELARLSLVDMAGIDQEAAASLAEHVPAEQAIKIAEQIVLEGMKSIAAKRAAKAKKS